MKLHNLGTFQAVLRPRKWRKLNTAPRDGTFIILRNPAWRNSIVVSWQNLAAYGVECEDEEGWIWEDIAIPETMPPAPFDFDEIGRGYESKTEWALFEISDQDAERIEQQLAQLEKAKGAH